MFVGLLDRNLLFVGLLELLVVLAAVVVLVASLLVLVALVEQGLSLLGSGTSATFVSHELLLHSDVAPLAQAAALLRHKRRLLGRRRDLVPLRHNNVARRESVSTGTQNVQLHLRRL